MPLNMTRPYRHPSTGVYWLRKAVPQALRPLIGKREFKRSLRTKDPTEARRLAPAVLQAFDRELSAARAGLTCGKRELDALTEEYQQKRTAELLAQARREGWDDTGFENETTGHLAILDNPPPGYRNPLDLFSGDYQRDPAEDAAVLAWGLPRVEALLRQHSFPIRQDLKEALAVRLYRADARALDDAAALYYGRELPSSAPTPRFLPPEARTLSGLFASFADYQQIAASTRADWSQLVEHFADFVKHRPPREISREDVQRYADHLRTIGGRGGRPLSAARINEGYLAALKAAFSWALDRKYIDTNPVLGVRVRERGSEKGPRRRGYTREEVASILQAARNESRPYIRWVPWLAAFTGARVSEILNARKADIDRVEGIWYIAIRPRSADDDAGPATVKNTWSRRCVPLHAALLDEGFLDYCRALPEGAFLFPGRWMDKHGSRAKTPANRLRNWIRPQLSDPDALAPVHSFRHWLVAEARSAGIDEGVQRQLTGHAARDVHDLYGPASVPSLKTAIDRIPSPVPGPPGAAAGSVPHHPAESWEGRPLEPDRATGP